ncbi:MAG TPA: alanine--tRNA ligase [Gemmatimonadales bacterium]|jgi:alanyl-tRNA synthetase
MQSSAIRRKFREFFVQHGHTEVASSSLEPKDDPTLLFTNAGMVQFKRTFLGQDPRPYTRATTCQKCVRAGGKHNDLEQVGVTRRHHTFFEMLGNFSFGDYFKPDAIRFAWEFVTGAEWLAIPADRLRVTVHHSDDEARRLWQELTPIPAHRIHGLGDADNFWQMGDTGPCGPCSEIFVDLEWQPGDTPMPMSNEEFERAAESGRFLEIWNLVFMQFDRSADGTLTPLPRPSVDTGAGLERIAAVMQGQDDNFHGDLFAPLLAQVGTLVGSPYPGGPQGNGVSYRVLADHARAVTFLLFDGVYPGNEGRGFVLRRILRRAVRHAWLLGRREPTLARLVPTVVALMADAYPALVEAEARIVEVVEREEANFYNTIEAGLDRLEQISLSGAKRIEGDDAFKLFDTFGFPIDLTELIAAEWGIAVDVAGFERAMEVQRNRSRAARTGSVAPASATRETVAELVLLEHGRRERFVGYYQTDVDTSVVAFGPHADGRSQVVLADSPFYPGGGGQVSDTGTLQGQGWSMQVTEIAKDPAVGNRLIGHVTGDVVRGRVRAEIDIARRHDIERNHSATHVAHLELRRALGTHVRQQGSLVEPERMRFDFSHHGPIEPSQLDDIEAAINERILENAEVTFREMPLNDALALGAMAFFADKYGDVVRVVQIGESIELCGGTHVNSSGQIGLFRFTSQGGVAAGVRRIEAVTGRHGYRYLKHLEHRLAALAAALHAPSDQLERKVAALSADRDRLEARLAEAMKGAPRAEAERIEVGGAVLVLAPTVLEDRGALGSLADTFRDEERGGAAVLVLFNPAAPAALSIAVTDALIARGKDANSLIKALASRFDGRGGGRPTFASGSLGVPSVEQVARAEFPAIVQEWLSA